MAGKREYNATLRTVRDRAAEAITSRLAWIAGKRAEFEGFIGRYEVLVAIDLDRGSEAEEALGRDWRKWARDRGIPGSAPTIYRMRNAGKVARILQGDAETDADGNESYPDSILGDVPDASPGCLVPLYRILSDAKTEEDRETAAGLIRETWSDLIAGRDTVVFTDADGNVTTGKVPPSPDEVLKAAEKIAPTKRSGGASKRKAATETAETGDESETDESRRASVVTVSAEAVEAATQPTRAILDQAVRDRKVAREDAVGIMLAALRLAAEHGITVVQAVLAGGSNPPAVAAETETAPTETAETAGKVAA